MIKFRYKQFTLQEGHYNGPKDMDEIPGALEVIGKSAFGGAGVGAVAEKFLGEDKSMLSGAMTGAKWGALGGIAAKVFLNYVHKPMSSVKYQDVDRNIRAQFGMFRMAGVTVGDSLDKRATFDEQFGTNDRNVTNYKINFAIHNNQVTMYTLGLTNDELEKVNKSLDYYCKKYTGMNYSAKLINQRVNAYSADIKFTNTFVLSNFIMELGKVLNTKINLLDNNAIVEPRIRESVGEEDTEEKDFSFRDLNKFDLMKLLSGGKKYLMFSPTVAGSVANYALGVIIEGARKLRTNELQKAGVLGKREDLGNAYLLNILRGLKYIEGFHYTVGEKKSNYNMSIISGTLYVTVSGSDKSLNLEPLEKYLKKSDLGETKLYTYVIKSDQDFKMLITRLMKVGKPNVYEG